MSLKRTRKEIESSEINEKPIKKRKLTDKRNDEEKIDDNAEEVACINDCYLMVIDTEVNGWRTGKGDKISGADPESRITQIAWTMFTKDGQKIQTKAYYIRPDGWEMTDEATKYTKITDEMLQTDGVPIIDALKELKKDFAALQKNDGFIAAHKYVYDAAMILNEIKRYQDENKDETFKELVTKLNSSATKENHIIDTLSLGLLRRLNQNSVFAAALKKQSDKIQRHLKWWPGKTFGARLSCLHQVVCGGDQHKQAHNAAVDVEMCAGVVFAVNNKYEINLFTSGIQNVFRYWSN